MNRLRTEVAAMGEVFEYQSDLDRHGRREAWYIMSPGREVGDCEDFVLTVFYRYFGFWGFVWHVLITHRAQIWRVQAVNGAAHAVGYYERLWFDNWTGDPDSAYKPEAMIAANFFDRTRHKRVKQYRAPAILFKLLAGKIGRPSATALVSLLSGAISAAIFWWLAA